MCECNGTGFFDLKPSENFNQLCMQDQKEKPSPEEASTSEMEVLRNYRVTLFSTQSIMKFWKILNEKFSLSPCILNK